MQDILVFKKFQQILVKNSFIFPLKDRKEKYFSNSTTYRVFVVLSSFYTIISVFINEVVLLLLYSIISQHKNVFTEFQQIRAKETFVFSIDVMILIVFSYLLLLLIKFDYFKIILSGFDYQQIYTCYSTTYYASRQFDEKYYLVL